MCDVTFIREHLQQLDALKAERDALKAERVALKAEQDALKAEAALKEERLREALRHACHKSLTKEPYYSQKRTTKIGTLQVCMPKEPCIRAL